MEKNKKPNQKKKIRQKKIDNSKNSHKTSKRKTTEETDKKKEEMKKKSITPIKKRVIESSKYIENPQSNKNLNKRKNEKKPPIEQQLVDTEEKEVEDKKRIWLIILLLLLLLLFFLKLNLKDILLGIPSKPVIGGVTEQDSNWSNKQTIYIKEDSKGRNKIKYYLYCINKENSINGCKWIKTETKNVIVTEHGTNFVFVKGVDEKGNISKPSDPIKVKIDTKSPIVEKLTTTTTKTTIKIKIEAIDEDSGIDYYIYQIKGREPVKSEENNYTFKDLISDTEYEITVTIVDKVGNKKEITVLVRTDKIDEENKDNSNNDDFNNKDNKNPNQKPDKNNTENNQNTIEKEIEEIPDISLSGVPLKFKYGERYTLPTSYKFGKSGGAVTCKVDQKSYQDTSTIPIGKREIICTARSNTNIVVTERKIVEIGANDKEENMWDGWITLTLHYPENSTNWQYTIMNPNETNSAEQKVKWNDYTGPITVRLSDVENIYLRYTLENGEEVVISQTGKLVAMPIAEKYSLKENEKTTINIYYSKEADKKQYRINGGSWQEYKGEFQVGIDSFIEARAIKNTNIYDNNGNILKKVKETALGNCYISEEATEEEIPIKGPNYPSEDHSLQGPTIQLTPQSITDAVKVTITTEKRARKIYYKEGSNGRYKEYNGEFLVTKNEYIYAYYIEDEEGITSSTTHERVKNIKVGTKPYVSINTDKDLYSGLIDKVNVTITGSDYNTLEYSFDGIYYYPYTSPLTVTENCTIYAKGTNLDGETIEYLEITNIGNYPPTKENLEVNIIVSPEKELVEGLINEIEVEINYDKKSEKKYYKINDGIWQEYTGKFTVKENCKITGYATSTNGSGSTSKKIDYLTTGIAVPIITSDTMKNVSQVQVSIEYDQNAIVKKYKIGEGQLIDYNGPFTVSENTTIYAYSKNALDDYSEATYMITNIVEMLNYTLLDKGSYYLLKLNYPTDSDPDTREYKWSSNGTWKKYNPEGILLVKQEYKDEIINSDGIKIVDDKGNTQIFIGDYYIVNTTVSEFMENLSMRWGYLELKTPIINILPDTPTRKLQVNIKYEKYLTKQEYKIEKPDGTITDWKVYKGPFIIEENNTIIYAKGATDHKSTSKTVVRKITNIDKEPPVIKERFDSSTPSQKISVQINAIDNMQVETIGYAKGDHKTSYFEDNGDFIRNGGTFLADSNGKYTLYASDEAGNETVKVINITNIDKTAPNIIIHNLTPNLSPKVEIEIDYDDSREKYYKIGENGNYLKYTESFEINSLDVKDLVNSDGTITIYAKGIDDEGNENEVKDYIYNLDLDIPNTPIINTSDHGYPILTEYGVEGAGYITIDYDNTRTDLLNYYSIDEGKTWNLYTGPFETINGKIIAKSIKKTTGLGITSFKNAVAPSDIITGEGYDGNMDTRSSMVSTGYVYIDKNMIGKKYYTKFQCSLVIGHTCSVEYLDENDNIIDKKTYSGYTFDEELEDIIPENTEKIRYSSGRNGISVYEIRPDTTPKIDYKDVYPTLTLYGIEKAHPEVSIEYSHTSTKKLYKIKEEGNWNNYSEKFLADYNQTIQAQGIDKNNNKSEVYSLTLTSPTDFIDENAYDGDPTTKSSLMSSGYVYVDKNMIGKKYYTKFQCSLVIGHTCSVEYLDENDNIIDKKTYSGYTFDEELEDIIPENTEKIRYSSGRNGISVYEIYPVVDESEKELSTYEIIEPDKSEYTFQEEPKIIVNDHIVEINYPNGSYTNEYSYDAVNWIMYNGSFSIPENVTIFARSIENDEVISSSSYKVTRMINQEEKKEEEIEITPEEISISLNELPDTINYGDDYKLPSSISYDPNRTTATVTCTSDGIQVNSTKELMIGNHHIQCVITTSTGLRKEASKIINIVEKIVTNDVEKGEDKNAEAKEENNENKLE